MTPWASAFLHPALLAGLGLVSVPIIIHLLHRLRFKRVRWAAMEFLLDSQKKNKRRLLIEHLLLLLLRCAAVALVVFVVARPQTSGQLAQWLGQGQQTEHYIILDDSLSMGQRVKSETGFDVARQVVERLTADLARQGGANLISMLRTSNPTVPDFISTALDEPMLVRTQKFLAGTSPSYLALSPAEAVQQASQMAGASSVVNKVCHLISDFQAKDWTPDAPLPARLKELAEAGVQIQLVDVSAIAPENVALINLDRLSSSTAVGVPVQIQTRVRNLGIQEAAPLPLTLHVDGKPLPSQEFKPLAPAKEDMVTAEVAFSSAGPHTIRTEIPADALPADNQLYLGVNVPPTNPVLIVDGSSDRRDSLYLALALSPGGAVNTGLSPDIRSMDELSATNLEKYRAVYLLNVPTMDKNAARLLTSYVEAGGGLAVFLGDQTDIENFNELLYAGGKGLMAAALTGRRSTAEAKGNVPAEVDFRPENHPIYRIFAGQRNSFLDTIAIREIIAVDDQKMSPSAKVIARTGQGEPLVLENQFGRGRTILTLTTAGDDWNSWPQNPTYVVAMLLLNEYLSELGTGDAVATVGEPWELEWGLAAFRREVRFIHPPDGDGVSREERREAQLDGTRCTLTITDTQKPGVYRVDRTDAAGNNESTIRTFNISQDDSRLAKVTRSELNDRMGGVAYNYTLADSFTGSSQEDRFEIKDWLLVALAAILVAEQFLGYRLSFHR